MNIERFRETAYAYWSKTPAQLALPNIEAGEFTVGEFLRKKTQDFDDALGKMVGTEDGLVKILSPIEKAQDEGFWVDPSTRGLEQVEVLVPQEELAPSSGYSIETLTRILYKHHCHSIYNLPRQLFTQDLCPKCWHEDCNKQSVGVGLINVWGSVMPVVMCADHALEHGHLMESSSYSNQSSQWKDACDEFLETVHE